MLALPPFPEGLLEASSKGFWTVIHQQQFYILVPHSHANKKNNAKQAAPRTAFSSLEVTTILYLDTILSPWNTKIDDNYMFGKPDDSFTFWYPKAMRTKQNIPKQAVPRTRFSSPADSSAL